MLSIRQVSNAIISAICTLQAVTVTDIVRVQTVIAYLMQKEEINFETAWQSVRDKRKPVRLLLCPEESNTLYVFLRCH